MTPLLCALFFLSGVAALLFETLWFRQAGLAFGNSVWASSLVLSSFMAGLALGNALAARFAGRLARPLPVYAVLELAIAVVGLALVFRLQALTPFLVPLLQPFMELPWLQNLLRLSLAFVLLLIPATAMGATLPVIVASLRARDPSFGGALGLLYGWNTLGAVLGAVLGELWLLEQIGIYGTAFAAAGCNLAAALGALALGPRLPRARAVGREAPARPGADATRLLAAAFLAGLLLLALEVVWFRFLHLFVHAGAAAFAWMLAVVLAGIGVGGLVAGAWLRRRPEAWRHAGGLALGSGVMSVLLYAGFHLSSSVANGWDPSAPRTVAWLAIAIAFPVAGISGALFPLLGAGLARSVSPETAATGWLTLSNTLGSALGSLLAGFVLLPALGMERSLFVLAAGYGAVAWLARAPRAERASWRRFAPAGVFLAVLALFPFGRMNGTYLQAPVQRFQGATEHAVVAVREGRTETALLVDRRFAGERVNRVLLTDSFSMSGTTVFARRYMKLYVYWPVALRPDPKSALLISYGVGSTAQALVATRSLESIDVVDISREILGLADVIHPDPESNPLRDPRVHVHVEDGRFFLQVTPRRFDLITGEPPPPKAAGVVNLYTREYFALVRDRLNEGGVVSYWLPVHNLLASDAKAITAAFCQVFPDCALWLGSGLDWMLTGSRGGLARPSEPDFARQWRDPALAPELTAVGLGAPEQLGATFLGDARWLREWTKGTPPLEDAWPKRLSNRLQADADAAFVPLMAASAARERFDRSEYIRATWPDALRERTLAYFDAQGAMNSLGRSAAVLWPERLRTVHRLLAEPAFPELALWHLGFTADHVAAERAARRAGKPVAPWVRMLASRALVDGDAVRAADGFERARRTARSDPGLMLLELYARCRAGQKEQARALLARWNPERQPAEVRDAVAWLRETFALAEGGGS